LKATDRFHLPKAIAFGKLFLTSTGLKGHAEELATQLRNEAANAATVKQPAQS
jgi:hypothetical protein